jgi:glutaconate CoA-transferase, subunit A
VKEKVFDLTAAAGLVASGSSVVLGGVALRRQPLALVREIIRQRITGLEVIAFTSGVAVDCLVGAGCVRKVQAAYVGLRSFGLAPNFCRAVEQRAIECEDASETTLIARFRAASLGVPFLPSRALLGTDIARRSRNVRDIVCPFTGQRLQALAAIGADVTLLHGFAADAFGNVVRPQRRNTEIDVLIAKAARKLVVTVEKLISHREVLRHSDAVVIPHNWVAAVVEAPFGAHPLECEGHYVLDEAHLRLYAEAARSEEGFRKYLDTYVYVAGGHRGYLDAIDLPATLLSTASTGWLP